MSRLLIPEPPLQVLPSLAKAIGLNEAIVLQQLHYLTLRSKGAPIERPLKLWIESDGDTEPDFPFWSERTVRRAFGELRDRGLVDVEQVRGMDRVNRYSLNYDAVDALCQVGPLQAANLAASMRSERPDASGQLDRRTSTRAQESRRQKEQQTSEPSPNGSGSDHVPSSPDGSEGTRRPVEASESGALTADELQRARDERKGRAAERNDHPDFVRLAALLAELVEQATDWQPKPEHVEGWRNDVRLMVERDNHSIEQIEFLIRWSHRNSFWRRNILSMGKLREKWPRLVAEVKAERGDDTSAAGGRLDELRVWVERELPDLAGVRFHTAVQIAGRWKADGEDFTADAVRAAVAERWPDEEAAAA